MPSTLRYSASLLLAASIYLSTAVAAQSSKKKSSTPKPDPSEESTPAPKKKKSASSTEDDESASTPKPSSKKSAHKKAASETSDDEPVRTTAKPKSGGKTKSSTPKAAASAKAEEEDAAPEKQVKSKKKVVTDRDDEDANADESTGKKSAASSTSETADKPDSGVKDHPLPGVLEPSDLVGFDTQPAAVQQLIISALALSKQGLTYKYGSDDPARGGMDCSGTMAYILRAQGFKDVPRDASGQYTWVRKKGGFYSVISKKSDSFEYSDLQPGDLLFWNGTYKIDRDPPVTHSMIYLGIEKRRKQHVMFGASDGRTYDGKSRWGVGVFDFRRESTGTRSQSNFLGYAKVPGLRP